MLYHYGEAEDPERIAAALAADPAARVRYQALVSILAALPDDPPPARGESYGAEVWARLLPRLREGRRGGNLAGRLAGWIFSGPARPAGLPRWAFAAAAVLLVAAGFLLGRSLPEGQAGGPLVLTAEGRQRMLEQSVAVHLADSERLLVELANARAGEPVGLGGEREWIDALLAGNRLYRQAAEKAGQRRIAALLAELEPILLDLVHAPEGGDPEDLALLQERLSEQGTLFKVRVLENRLAGAAASRARRAEEL